MQTDVRDVGVVNSHGRSVKSLPQEQGHAHCPLQKVQVPLVEASTPVKQFTPWAGVTWQPGQENAVVLGTALAVTNELLCFWEEKPVIYKIVEVSGHLTPLFNMIFISEA